MKKKSIFSFPGSLVLMLVLVLGDRSNIAAAQQSETTNLNVFGASSLTNALQDIEPLYEQSRPNVDITYNFAASGVLANQILQGAPADVFFSASEGALDTVETASLLLPGTRRDLLNNRLAIVTPANSTLSVSGVQDLTNPQVSRVAVGNPSNVPAGQYAQELLNNFGVSQQLQPKLVFGNNVRDVLSLVETGQADAGIVYITDALQSNQVKVANIPPTDAYSPIIYPVAALQRTQIPETAIDYINFLSSPQATDVFQRLGFTIARSTPPVSVPEPTSALGLLALGAMGVGLGLKRKKASVTSANLYSVTCGPMTKVSGVLSNVTPTNNLVQKG
ncbi:molybdate ABC transporter substrate-binding protein [Tolypothrix campylonemoides VB511288]|nr:molybdate ABC transporter substrate-binding protein [Tolypothrix campylonemoides VB511288]